MSYQILSSSLPDAYKVSVVIPVYNSEEFIAETLQSIFSQNLQPIEVITVDDGSTDKSEEILKDFATRYPNMAYIKQKNSGPGVARNTGIELAKGTTICFVDSDDLLPEAALETLYTTLIHHGADMVTGASISFNSKRTWYIQGHVNHGVYNPGSKTLITHPELLYSIGPCNKLFKSELIQEIRFPSGIKVTEDQPFVIEAYLKSNKIFSTDKVIYNYRRRESEQTTSLSQTVTTNALNVIRDIINSLKVSDPLWNKYITDQKIRAHLQAYYYNRILQSDLWPAIINFLRQSKENHNKVLVLNLVGQWIFTIDPSVMVNFKSMGSAKKMSALEKGIGARTINPIKSRIFIDRCWKLKTKALSLLKKFGVTPVLYPFFKFKKLEDKILFISSKVTHLNASEEELTALLNQQWPNHQIKVYLQKSKNISQFFSYLQDLATAKVVIADDYTFPYKLYKRRPEIKVMQKEDFLREFTLGSKRSFDDGL